MAVKWTKEQQQVIELRDRDILVSAAAGSGKTAVLVERIIHKITDTQNPVDIDHILVVTFTKAAAAEMRERISGALEQKQEENPSDTNLMKQSALIHNAMITTIDSFCLFVVRNYFNEIQLEPNFRIADEGEIRLLEMDVLDEVFERAYEQSDEKFLKLIDSYSGKRSDSAVRDMVMQVYRMSLSSAWPLEWIQGLKKLYETESEEELLESDFMQEFVLTTRRMIADIRLQAVRMKELAEAPDGPQKYLPAIEADIALLDEACTLTDYRQFYQFFSNMKFQNLAAIRNFAGDVQKKEGAAALRTQMKKDMEDLRQGFSMSPEQLLEQLRRLRPMAEALVELTVSYLAAMEAAKRKKRIVDFSDMEHFALNILVDKDTKEPTPTARQFRQHFDEIMIDEYQDSNLVQEIILRAISKEQDGGHNLFMVGDVKQSIYRFRLARPELFMDKYRAYSRQDGRQQRIDLHRNFRSRSQVLDFANDVFYKLMHHDLGEVDYDDAAALYCGASYPQTDGMEAELLLFDEAQLKEQQSELSDVDKHRLEARMVALKIRRLMQMQQVTDKKTGQLRPMKYSDIVILFRSLRGWGSEFAEVLEAYGIPAHVESQTGYFAALEVRTVLNMLRILDNPYQDIPMAAVLSSPMVGLDNEEMAELRVRDREVPFAMSAMSAMEEAQEGALARFYQVYQKLRRQKDLPIHELIVLMLRETGYGQYVAAMPAGEKRAENLRMLVEKAIAYEKTSYKGLFHFVRYIEQLQKYEIDFGEADVSGENADVVHIMTIHKSKGLEFPVVFVSGMAKMINQMDTKEKLVLHPDMGMGLKEMSAKPRMKRSTLVHAQIAGHIRRENLGEELRILYVALTRAKEKLILTGVIRDREKTFAKYTANVLPKQPLFYMQRARAVTYLDWLIPAVSSYPDRYEITFVQPQELLIEEAKEHSRKDLDYATMWERIQAADMQQVRRIEEEFSYEYPYQQDAAKKSKYSVSELKHAKMAERFLEEDAQLPEFLLQEHESYVPAFAEKFEEKPKHGDTVAVPYGVSRGALRGTAVHRCMECLDFVRMAAIDVTNPAEVRLFVQEELNRMEEKQELTEEMRSLITPEIIEKFASGNLGQRMADAAVRGELFKEKPFVMEYDGVLVQGIIDVFWFEEDGIVVLDYKTDRVNAADELILRYQTQLELYADALERIFSTEETKRTVKEKLLYSFRLQEEIRL